MNYFNILILCCLIINIYLSIYLLYLLKKIIKQFNNIQFDKNIKQHNIEYSIEPENNMKLNKQHNYLNFSTKKDIYIKNGFYRN